VANVGIGKVKFGMSRDEIVAIMGEPETEQAVAISVGPETTAPATNLNYSSLGLQLLILGDEPGKLHWLIANPVDEYSQPRHDFVGQTDTGIRMGASVQDVIDAYGVPDAPVPGDSTHGVVVRYEKIGTMFSFANGKLIQIMTGRSQRYP
jgi:hypothetical protein